METYAIVPTELRTRMADDSDLRGALGCAYGATYARRDAAEYARRVLDEEREILHRGEGIRYWLVSLEPDEDGRTVATCLDIQGCCTDGATVDEALAMIGDALALHEDVRAD